MEKLNFNVLQKNLMYRVKNIFEVDKNYVKIINLSTFLLIIYFFL